MSLLLKRICQVYLLVWVVVTILWKVTGYLTPMNPSTGNILLLPSWNHVFGTDALGRDLAGRIIEGGFISLVVSLSASTISVLLALFVGVFWTWFRSSADPGELRPPVPFRRRRLRCFLP